MAALTKAQLAAELEALRIAYQTMEQRALSAEAQLSAPRTTRAPAHNLSYRARLAAAREQAMTSGRTVLVARP